jgi:hypothetical protein
MELEIPYLYRNCNQRRHLTDNQEDLHLPQA